MGFSYKELQGIMETQSEMKQAELIMQQDCCVSEANIHERTMTPCEKLGLTVGSFAVYLGDNYCINPIVKLYKDDTTHCPGWWCNCNGTKRKATDTNRFWLRLVTISNYFSDNKNPSENELILLALDLGVSIECLKEQIRLLS